MALYMLARHLRALRPLVLSGGLLMSAQSTALEVGDSAPDFTLTGSDGRQHRLADYRGTALVVAWFPKAFTGG